ncbi:hypothetical protein CGL51_11930 [Pyrobaculum aerophilum]|uniref:Alcohol dehydrogenase n=2 Tax=Pyrobaculum aerophilum TaxID=13773 RepID=A0A371R1Z3_9CREN|nr:hypothetical protein CGL51_11930 [Pyrobaculum aerophilum]RFA97533.1 hypothetical protein CGL52_09065 [Pyrobaculum aerophilum]
MIQLMTGIRKIHKAAFFYEIAGPFKIDEVPTSEEVPPYGLLVKTRSVGICHSDLHLWQGDYKSIGLPKSLPWIVGHEIVGTIAKKGSLVPESLREGTPVLVYAWQPADENDEIVAEGYTQLASRRRRYAFDIEGGLQEYIVVPHYKYVIPLEGFEEIESIAPLGCAGLTTYNAVKKIRKYIRPDDYILIVGLGGLGIYAVQWAKVLLPEANIIAVDIREEALQFASKIVRDVVYTKVNANTIEIINKITKGRGVRAVIDLVSNNNTVPIYSKILATKGVYNLVGLMGHEVTIPTQILIRKEIALITTYTGSLADQINVIKLAKSNKINYKEIISERFKFTEEDVNKAFNKLKEGKILGRGIIVF